MVPHRKPDPAWVGSTVTNTFSMFIVRNVEHHPITYSEIEHLRITYRHGGGWDSGGCACEAIQFERERSRQHYLCHRIRRAAILHASRRRRTARGERAPKIENSTDQIEISSGRSVLAYLYICVCMRTRARVRAARTCPVHVARSPAGRCCACGALCACRAPCGAVQCTMCAAVCGRARHGAQCVPCAVRRGCTYLRQNCGVCTFVSACWLVLQTAPSNSMPDHHFAFDHVYNSMDPSSDDYASQVAASKQ